MLDLLTRMTHAGESVTVRYTRRADDSVELLVQLALSGDPDLVTDEDALKARAALCRPVLFRGSHADVCTCLTRHVQDSADARGQLRDAYADIAQSTKDAAKAAAQAAASKKAKASTPTAPAGNPSSLF